LSSIVGERVQQLLVQRVHALLRVGALGAQRSMRAARWSAGCVANPAMVRWLAIRACTRGAISVPAAVSTIFWMNSGER
jgi:hypothetical protein